MTKGFRWGETPPKWFMREVAEAFRQMGANREAIHVFDTQDAAFIFTVCPIYKVNELAAKFGRVYQEVFAENDPQFIQNEHFRVMVAEDIGVS